MPLEETAQVVAFPSDHVTDEVAFLRGLPSDATRVVYGRALRQFRVFLGDKDLADVTRRDVEAFRVHFEQVGRAASTIAKTMSALSGFFGFLLDEGSVDRNPVATARRPRVSDVSPRRGLSRDEVAALLAAVDAETLAGKRDRVLLLLLAVQGLRIAEVLALNVEDLDEEQGHRVALVEGKGRRVERVPLAGSTWSAISTWCEAASIAHGPIVVPVLKGDRVVHGRAISCQSAWKRIRNLAERGGVDRAVHPHLFRHGAVTQALAAGVPLHQVQDFARHADPRTTRRYDSLRQSLSNPTAHVLASLVATWEEE